MSDVKEKMIEIATDTAQKTGVRGITMRDLGDAVGIKSSSVMYHFKNKDGLLLAISGTYAKLFLQRLRDIEVMTADPGKRLQGLVDLFEEALSADKMCLCGMLAAQSRELDYSTQATIKDFFQDLQDWIGAQLSALGADPELAAVAVSALEGAMLLDKLDGRNARTRAVRLWLRQLAQG